MVRSLALLVLAALLLAGCKAGDSPSAGRVAKAAPAAPSAARAPTVPVRPAEPSPAAEPAPAPANAVAWKGNVQWHSWEEGSKLAAQQSKPIFLLLYADWCPHCRALGAVFADPEIEALSKRFVMVRQNHDENPSWMEPFKKYGGYVPRIFFLDSKGKMREEVTSGHPRYPYFYAAEAPDFLKQSMRRVIGT